MAGLAPLTQPLSPSIKIAHEWLKTRMMRIVTLVKWDRRSSGVKRCLSAAITIKSPRFPRRWSHACRDYIQWNVIWYDKTF